MRHLETLYYKVLTPSLLFLLGSGVLAAFATALLKLGKYQSRERLKSKTSKLFFFRCIVFRFFRKDEWENLYFCVGATKNIVTILYAISTFFLFLTYLKKPIELNFFQVAYLSLLVILISISIDFIMRLTATLWPIKILKLTAPITSAFLLLFCPITLVLLKITRVLFNHKHHGQTTDDHFLMKQKIKEILSDTQKHLDPNDQKLISSFITFRERVAREIMVPRIDLCTLSADTTVKEACPLFLEEGYSRIPVYKETLDHIIGVILYKDFLNIYSNPTDKDLNLNTPIEKIIKPVIYAPENKKISHLLQEFKAKQIHLAIIVNEYGGTEGIVTIEDILEELVGEIEDEYDVEEDRSFWKLPEGAFVVNAKMSIVDIEDELNISLPHHPEYETIGGFVFHKAGSIPQKGWSIHLDAFQLEVLSSDDRSVKKILITPSKTIS